MVPLRMTDRQVQRFILDNRQWVTQTIDRIAARLLQVERLSPECYHHGALVPFQGRKYPLQVAPGKSSAIKISFHDAFIAELPAVLLDTDYSAALREALILWMKRTMALHAEQIVLRHASRQQLVPRSIHIKAQKSRWGSCGIKDDIHLNWLLMLAPPDVLEYVVVHELCHLRHRNHSPDFWGLVEDHLPEFRRQRLWLKENGASLMMGL